MEEVYGRRSVIAAPFGIEVARLRQYFSLAVPLSNPLLPKDQMGLLASDADSFIGLSGSPVFNVSGNNAPDFVGLIVSSHIQKKCDNFRLFNCATGIIAFDMRNIERVTNQGLPLQSLR